MADFSEPQGSLSGAIGVVATVANEAASASLDAVTAANPTLTAAQTINAVVTLSGQTAAQTVTTPTAAAIVAAMPNPLVGTAFDLVIRNEHTSSGAATLAAGSGVTLDGTTVIPVAKTQILKGILTNVTAGAEAVTVYGLLTAPI
jgi:hypothetical protein